MKEIRSDSPISRVLESATLVVALIVVAICIIAQNPRGDEPTVYMPVIEASKNVWPALNRTEVAYGISPVWTWATGLAGQFGLNAPTAGRAVSLVGWLACLALAGLRGRRFFVVFCLVHPALLIFAARCHPFWLAIAFLMGAAQTKNLVLRCCLAAACTSLQPFLIPAVVAIGGLPAAGTWIKRCANAALMLGVAAAGMLSNWWLYGGQYPEAFKKTGYLLPYEHFDGFNEIYFPLVAAGAGGMIWLYTDAKAKPKWAALFAILAAVAAFWITSYAGIAKGPIASMAMALGKNGVILWALALGIAAAGLAKLSLRDWMLAGCLLMAAVSLSRLPFSYERYAWFTVMPVLLVRELMLPKEESSATRPGWILLATVAAAAVFCIKSSL